VNEHAPEPTRAGATVNELLFLAGLLEAFGEAARARDRARMLDLLHSAGLGAPEATVDAILARPEHYGF
jgi:hypothetical protein